jgi:hypothetical protein
MKIQADIQKQWGSAEDLLQQLVGDDAEQEVTGNKKK